MNPNSAQIPSATYRLQLSGHASFARVEELSDFFGKLGIGAVYLSPIFRAVAGSTHGYDIIDYSQLEPTLGDDDSFESMANSLRSRGIGLLVDVVPNHMGIDDPNNRWWRDVLRHGRMSPFARFFDIDWTPPKESLHGKVLLAILGDQFGNVLEAGELRVEYLDGLLEVRYFERTFPTDPATWLGLLQEIHARTRWEDAPQAAQYAEELAMVLGGTFDEATRARLAMLVENCEPLHRALQEVLVELNGKVGEPRSFDRLEAFLSAQPYRMCYWRVATDEINYRRFFDVNMLAAIRVEDPLVFGAVHDKLARLVRSGLVTGLRIDHADGLRDPQQYLSTLAETASASYVVVEKILSAEEALPQEWPIQGTTGYDFLSLVNRLFIDGEGLRRLRDVYSRFIGGAPLLADVVYESKRAILSTSLSSEVYVLSQQLDRIAEQHRDTCDFTRPALHRALRELVACFPVYRTYIREHDTVPRDEDRQRILDAVRVAKRRNPAMSDAFFDFIGSVLLLEDPEDCTEKLHADRREFVLKFQQITGPVTAKGVEDTAFYRFYPLASLNEVGSSPVAAPVWVEQFHDRMSERTTRWPHSMLATATHDTKRGEDLRARLNVLSEVPSEWEAALARWHEQNSGLRGDVDGLVAPDTNEEYLIYQTLVGTWPISPQTAAEWQDYVDRINQYLEKALREAKVNTSWLSPKSRYEEAIRNFVTGALQDHDSPFVQDLNHFARSIADAGFVNSLAQLAIKMCAPGIPDFYQGCELWDFSLVDPDNRRPVDFERRRRMLSELHEVDAIDRRKTVRELLPHWPDDRLKMFTMERVLKFRHEHQSLFLADYLPLAIQGDDAAHACAFARRLKKDWLACITPRFVCRALRESASSTGESGKWIAGTWWSGCRVELPEDAPKVWRHLISGETFTPNQSHLDLGEVFQSFPVAVLHAVEE